jgi:shikimate dehydrogenase/3-dehydroquinate dehydratase type I
MTSLCAVIQDGTADAARAHAARALAAGADLVEFRFDSLRASPEEVRALAAEFGSRAVATLRPNGAPPGADLVSSVCTSGFAYVDLDAALGAAAVERARASGSRVILSAHPPSVATPQMIRRFAASHESRADIVKYASPVQTSGQALDLVEEGRARPGSCLIGTGERGRLTRALAWEMGSAFQYVTDDGVPAAPGQFSLETALRLRRDGKFLLGVIGFPLERTLSPLLHNAALEKLDLPAVYLALPTPPADLARLLRAAATLRIRGLSVTMPHKAAVLPHLDEVAPLARATAAVNSIVFEQGRAVGHNTDVHGFTRTLQGHGLLRGDEALVVGAGGAARSVIHVLSGAGYRVSLSNRHPERARELARRHPALQLYDPGAGRKFDLVVNCTPVDSATESPVPAAAFSRDGAAIDLTYPDHETRFLHLARVRGALGITGREMLLHQAAKAFELWTGKAAPVAAMRRALEEAP